MGPNLGIHCTGRRYEYRLWRKFWPKGETPGLGAEIETEEFQKQFVGKKIFDESGNFVSVKVVKGGAAPEDLMV